MKHLNALGADEIIPVQYETSVEIFVRLLEKYLIPREDIEKLVNEVRANGYRMMRKLSVNTGIDNEFDIKYGLQALRFRFLKLGMVQVSMENPGRSGLQEKAWGNCTLRQQRL